MIVEGDTTNKPRRLVSTPPHHCRQDALTSPSSSLNIINATEWDQKAEHCDPTDLWINPSGTWCLYSSREPGKAMVRSGYLWIQTGHSKQWPRRHIYLRLLQIKNWEINLYLYSRQWCLVWQPKHIKKF